MRRGRNRFAKLFDGFSFGSNDLTQVTLGVDRDSAIVAFDYDERDDGVKEMIRLAVEGCRRNGIHSVGGRPHSAGADQRGIGITRASAVASVVAEPVDIAS